MKHTYRVRPENSRKWSGQRYVLDVTIGGKRRQLRFKTEAAAHDKAIELLAKDREGRPAKFDGESPRVADFIERFLEDKAVELRPNTLRSYGDVLRRYVVPYFGRERLAELQTADFAEFKTRKLREGYSASLVNRILRHCSMLYSYAEEIEVAATNPVAKVRRPKVRRAEMVIPSKPEIAALIEAAKAHSLMAHAAILLMVFAGLRFSEVRGIRGKDIDCNSNRVYVRQACDRFGNVLPPKSEAGLREIPVLPEVVAVLREWLIARKPNQGDFLFASSSGRAMDQSNIRNRLWVPIIKDAGLLDEEGKPLYSPHQLRHAAISLWIEKDFNPREVMSFAGHSNITITYGRYGHLFGNDARRDEKIASMGEGILS